MQFLMFLVLTTLHVTITVYAFRDYPTNYLNQTRDIKNIKSTSSKNTFYEKSFSHILARKKRGFVFFKGAVVVLTQVLSKHIVAKAPRGVIHSSEVDIFYDLPILVEGWRKPLDAFGNRTKGIKKSDDQIDNLIEGEKITNIGVINASAIPWDKYYKTSQGPNWNRFAWNNQQNWNKLAYPNRRYFYRKPYIKSSSNNYYSPNYHRRNYNQLRYQKTNNLQRKLSQYPMKKYNQSVKPQRSKSPTIKNVNPLWHENREYRERRGIFEHVEGFGKKLGISLRSCILRAICEIKTELLPEGESFINDVARIFFTIPTNHENKEDDFVQMALEDDVDCVRRFMVSCPHSPLKYLFNNFRATNMPTMSEQDMMRNLMYA